MHPDYNHKYCSRISNCLLSIHYSSSMVDVILIIIINKANPSNHFEGMSLFKFANVRLSYSSTLLTNYSILVLYGSNFTTLILSPVYSCEKSYSKVKINRFVREYINCQCHYWLQQNLAFDHC